MKNGGETQKRNLKKCLDLLLFLGSICASSVALSETDADLRKKLEILEARITELEGRLEGTGEQPKGQDRSVDQEKSGHDTTSTQDSSPKPALAPPGAGGGPQALKAKVADIKPSPGENGWENTESKALAFDSKKFHGGVTLRQDAFFGFQTILNAGYEATDNIDFTFYSWLWTSPNFGRSRVVAGTDGIRVDPGGNGLWTGVGMGLNFRFLDDALSITPQFGILNGALLSSPIIGRRIRAAEGVLPSITISYDDDLFTGQGHFAYSTGIRDKRSRDFIHNWVSLGVKPAFFNFKNVPINSVGVYWEHLRFHVDRVDDNPGTLFNWIGPYVELALPLHLALRFAAGADLKGDMADEFYQASIKMHF